MCSGELEKVLNEVARLVTPSPDEYREVWSTASQVVDVLSEEFKRRGIDVRVEVEGSIAKDTWLSGDRDIDIFIVFPRNYSVEEAIRLGLEVSKDVATSRGWSWIEKYADHPYLRISIGEYEVDVVPCMEIKPNEKPLTAADRTPLHTQYVRSKLSDDLRRDVRILKKFMKTIGVYGAEIKVRGFSGYLCELLVIAYGGFTKLIEDASKNWRPYRVVIDLEHYYPSAIEARRAFKNDVLVVIDPVDRSRNVAAAVSLEKFCTFIAASKLLLEKPSLNFFFPQEVSEVTVNRIADLLRERDVHIVAIETKAPKVSPDVLWGQIERSLRAVSKLLNNYGFTVLYSSAWSDEETTVVLVFEVEQIQKPRLEKHLGPPVYSDESRKFLEKWISRAVVGPYIEGNRWVVYRERKFSDVRTLLRSKIFEIGLGKYIAEALRECMSIYIDDEVLDLCRRSKDFTKFLVKFLRRAPPWLPK
ncbi:MAG: CCA tRNA nucleotidyltransferase [Thermoprotei archaeon]|nr:MAG: CCA tRNA nucleotidyltransferase [Thermoprotei archaeon]